jgi:hypothetical protein
MHEGIIGRIIGINARGETGFLLVKKGSLPE